MSRPRMDCARFRAWHLDFLDDALPASSRAACERHRDRCATCAVFDARVRRSLMLVRSLAPLPAACDVTARVLAAVGHVMVPSALVASPAPSASVRSATR